MNNGFRVVHYVNQLFGGIGSEEKANLGPQVKVGPVGPGRAIQNELRERGYIVATAICGDNYFVERIDKAAEELLRLISPCKPDILIAGPAFNAGRYGVACGEVCKLVQDKLSIPAVTGMYEENPGVDLYRKDVYIIGTSDSAMGMTAAIPLMVNMAYKLVAKEDIGNPKKEGYFARGFSVNEKLSKNAAERAVDAVIAKIKNQPVESEISVQHFEHTNPAPPIKDLSSARICLVTDGGLIPKGNPDKLMPRSAERFGSYNIRGISALSPEAYEAYHVGHDTSFINQDPHRLVPLDVMRELEEEGVIGETHEIFVTTAGVAASLSNSQKVGKDIATQLKNEGVDAAILTST
jgi:glycine reductase